MHYYLASKTVFKLLLTLGLLAAVCFFALVFCTSLPCTAFQCASRSHVRDYWQLLLLSLSDTLALMSVSPFSCPCVQRLSNNAQYLIHLTA